MTQKTRNRVSLMSDSQNILYFDYAASNPLWPEAAQAMIAAGRLTGNASATHSFGRAARQLLDQSRRTVADFLKTDASRLTFTSGATEANNLALFGLLGPLCGGLGAESQAPRLLTSHLEHSSINQPAARLADRHGLAVDWLSLGDSAVVDPDQVVAAIKPDTVAVCLTAANNVLGSIQPVAQVSVRLARIRQQRKAEGNDRPLYLIVDAVQAAAWLELRPEEWGTDALIVSAHKAGGPKGVGCLCLRSGLELEPQAWGGGQEQGRRSGTENLAAIAGMAAALQAVSESRDSEAERCRRLRDRLVTGLESADIACRLLGASAENNLPGTAFVHFPNQPADALALKLDAAGLAVAAGSACEAGQRRSPAVLAEAYGSSVAKWGGLRISFGRFTGQADIDRLVQEIKSIVSGR